MPEAAAICDFSPKKQALLHDILERIADKWTLLVIEALDGEGEMRFSGLQRRVGQISHKMLTKTLRQLERDGLVTRRVHAEVPPRVDYKLTALGESLCESLCGVWTWVGQHMPEVERARLLPPPALPAPPVGEHVDHGAARNCPASSARSSGRSGRVTTTQRGGDVSRFIVGPPSGP